MKQLPIKKVNAEQAEKFCARVLASPFLHIPCVMKTKRIGWVGGYPPDPSKFFLEDTDLKLWRLPDELSSWAYDVIAHCLVVHNFFPVQIEFGKNQSGEFWAHIPR